MVLCLKDACFKIDKVIAITRAQSVIPISGYEDDTANNSTIDNSSIVCNLLNIFLEGYTTPISIIYDSIEERDNAYDFAIKCFSEYSKGV